MLNSNEVLNGNFSASRRWIPGGHNGIDWRAPNGTIVKSRFAGVVRVTGTNPPGQDFGNYIRVYHPTLNISSWYAHLQSFSVKVGQQVSQGQQIGLSNNTGLSTGPHLHYSESNGEGTAWIDPDTTQGGDEPVIENTDNWFARMNQLMSRLRGRNLDRDEFVKNFVGNEPFRMVEVLSDDPAANQAQQAQEVGQVALRDDWEGQIKKLTEQLAQQPSTPSVPSQGLTGYSLGELLREAFNRIIHGGN